MPDPGVRDSPHLGQALTLQFATRLRQPPPRARNQELHTMNIKAFFALAVVALVGMTNAEADHAARELQVADFSKQLLDAVNAKRAEKGLAAVCISTKLAKAAQVLAADNAKNNKVSTKGSDGSTPTTRYDDAGIETAQSAELVAAGQASITAIMKTWGSNAYLFSDFKFIGPGYAYDKTKTYKHYWVLDFANADAESCA